MDKTEIYKKALDRWGPQLQKVVAIEEFAELIKEISHDIRWNGGNVERIVEEMADAEIMLEQLKAVFNVELQISKEKEKKLFRLQAILESTEDAKNENKT